MDGSRSGRLARSLTIVAFALLVPAVAGAIEIGGPSLEELLRRAGSEAVLMRHTGDADTVRDAARRPLPPGSFLVARIPGEPRQRAIPDGFRVQLPLEILAADAADTRLLGMRLVLDTEFASFHWDDAARRFVSEVRIGLVDTIDAATAPLARPVVVQLAPADAEEIEPRVVVLDHAGPPWAVVRLAAAEAAPQAGLRVSTDLVRESFAVALPFEEPVRITLSPDHVPGFGFGRTRVTLQGPAWANSTTVRLRARHAVVSPSQVMLRGGTAQATVVSRLLGRDSVTATGDRLAARSAVLDAGWPWGGVLLVFAAALVGGVLHPLRYRTKRPARVLVLVGALGGSLLAAVGVAALQWVPTTILVEAPAVVLALLGGYSAARALERTAPPHAPLRTHDDGARARRNARRIGGSGLEN